MARLDFDISNASPGDVCFLSPDGKKLQFLTLNEVAVSQGQLLTSMTDVQDYAGNAGKVLQVNPTADGTVWVAGGGGGVTTFVGLTDVPNSYAGEAGNMLVVNPGQTGLIFQPVPSGGATAWTGLSDTVGSITANGYVRANALGTQLEFTPYTTADDIVVGSDADGDIYVRSASALARLPKGTALQVMRMDAGGALPEWADESTTADDIVVGSDADGDVYFRSGGTLVRLPKGTATQVLTMNGAATAPEWAASAAGVTNWVGLSDTPGSITANYYVKGNGTGTGLIFEQYATADDLIVGSDADGDLYFRSGGALTRLGKGTASQVLTMNGGATAPEWATSPAGVTTFLGLSDTPGSFVANELLVQSGAALTSLTQPTADSFLIWDDTLNQHVYIPLQIGSINESELIGEIVPLTADTPKAMYARVSDGKLIRASAATAGDAAYRFAGFIPGDAYAADATVVLTGYGKVDFDGNLTPGAKYYLQDAVGTIGTTPGTVKIPVGISTTGGDLLTYPQPLQIDVDPNAYSITSGEAFAIGDVLYQKQSDGKYYKAVATALDEALKGACVVATEAASAADETKLVTGGAGRFINVPAGAWTAGDILYITDTAGTIDDTAGTNAWVFAQAHSTTVIRQIATGNVLAL